MVEKNLKALITGVPSTGKTCLAKAWSEHTGCKVLSLNELVEEKKIYSQIDEEDMAKVVELGKLKQLANEWLGAQAGFCIVEGHLGCEVRLDVDLVVVLRLNPKELEKRLSMRGYVPSKIRANKLSELLDYCTIRSLQTYPENKVYEIDVSGRKGPKDTFADFEKIISGGKESEKFRPYVSWAGQLLADADSLSKE